MRLTPHDSLILIPSGWSTKMIKIACQKRPERTTNKLNKFLQKIFGRHAAADIHCILYSYFVERSEQGFKCQLKYFDKKQIVQARIDRRCVTKLVKMIMKSLPLEDGVLSLRCELRSTNCEAHITLMS